MVLFENQSGPDRYGRMLVHPEYEALRMGRLSTHVLDLPKGRPAAGIELELLRLAGDEKWVSLVRCRTNADGRTDAPLLSGEGFAAGTYLLNFHVADYYRLAGTPMADPPFLDIVPLRFTIGCVDAHYHVPLLVTPWSYSTYRGS